MIVLKFGGTSVGSPESIRQVARIVLNYKAQQRNIVVVNSAMSGITNLLVEAAERACNSDSSYLGILEQIKEKHLSTVKVLIDIEKQTPIKQTLGDLFRELEEILYGVSLIKELTPRTSDLVLSFGERMASSILSYFLNESGAESEYLDTRKLIRTDRNFGNARVDFETTNYNIQKHFEEHSKLQIATGFIAVTDRGATTTLGRGGSDYTASILGGALPAERVEIWTDVDGVMSANPKVVKEAFSLRSLSYEEAMEISHFGAKVIYPPSIQPVYIKQIPIYVRNTFNPDFEGTRIGNGNGNGKNHYPIKGISTMDDIALINLQGSGLIGVADVSARLFSVLNRARVNIILIAQASSEHSISFAVDPKDVKQATKLIKEEFGSELASRKIDPLTVEHDLSILAIVGEKMRSKPGVTGKFFTALGKNGVNILSIAQGVSELNVSAVIEKKNLSKAVNTVHESFFLSNHKTVNLFIVGAGLIGGTLLEQIRQQADVLRSKKLLKINVVAVARSRKMLFETEGISLENWREELEEKGEPTMLDAFVKKMNELNLPNSIFVDNTSSAEVVQHYLSILDSSVSVVTPNKLASSGPYLYFQGLKDTAFRNNVRYMYETNVGAGLPVLTTLNDLKNSGDEILCIEGVLSGTLSYIFNTFDGSQPFSEVVKAAKAKGFTEPDPRDDLNGADVARKILILARESGYDLELGQVEIRPILPESCLTALTIDEFFKELQKFDETIEQQCVQARKEGKVLRVIASLKDGRAQVGLEAVDSSHPFYSLSGSDNMISFQTTRYNERPLVIKGPGAGAEVTAAGVFAEIISLSNYLS